MCTVYLEVGGEHEVAEVDGELAAPDREPCQVLHLEQVGIIKNLVGNLRVE